jgi:hypothetical protein
MTQIFLAAPFQWTDPHTWPWFLYVWAAFLIVSWVKPLWPWLQRRRAESWPISTGQIESTAVNDAKRSFFSNEPTGSRAKFVAELEYSYWATGKLETGTYRREFGSNEEAWEFQRDLKGKSVVVHYNPNKPSKSAVSESSIAALLQTRSPRPDSELASPSQANAIPPVLARFLWIFVVLSAVGLLVSLWVSLAAFAGRTVLPGGFFILLHVGIFVVWFPAVLVAVRRVGNAPQKDFWKIVLSGSPDWMRYMVYIFFGYSFISIFLSSPSGGVGVSPPPTSGVDFRECGWRSIPPRLPFCIPPQPRTHRFAAASMVTTFQAAPTFALAVDSRSVASDPLVLSFARSATSGVPKIKGIEGAVSNIYSREWLAVEAWPGHADGFPFRFVHLARQGDGNMGTVMTRDGVHI